MSFNPVPGVENILKSDWNPEEYGLLYHFDNFSRLANSVITEPGELQRWFGEALWRYAPFNARVMSANGAGACWETRAGDQGTANALGNASFREGRGGYEVLASYGDLGISKNYVLRPDVTDVQISARCAKGPMQERVPLLLRDRDILHLDYGKCPATGTSPRVLGVVSRKLAIERNGQVVLRFDLGAAAEGKIKCTADRDGFIRALNTFSLPSIYFGRTGYRIFLDG